MPPDQVLDASDEKQINDARAAAGRRQKRLDDGFSLLLADKRGREWLWDILGRCHIGGTPFVRGETDSTAFQCGEQNIGFQLMAQLSRVSPETYSLMMKENTDG